MVRGSDIVIAKAIADIKRGQALVQDAQGMVMPGKAGRKQQVGIALTEPDKNGLIKVALMPSDATVKYRGPLAKPLTKGKPSKRASQVSKKMSERLKEYRILRGKFLHEYQWCCCDHNIYLKEPTSCSRRSEDIHHMRGRGKFLLDKTTWLAVCRNHHRMIHDNPVWAAQHGYLQSRLSK